MRAGRFVPGPLFCERVVDYRILSASPTTIALAEQGKAPDRFLLIRDGDVGWADNRQGFVMDPATAARMIAAFEQHGAKIPIDYHHATERVQPGQKAPAAGFVTRLEYVEGDGLYAAGIEWTDEGRADVESRRFVYTSPAVRYADKRKMMGVSSVALTNTPRTIDAKELIAAAERVRQGDRSMDRYEKLKTAIADIAKRLRITMAQEDEGSTEDIPEFPAISADMKAVGDLIEVLKGAGVEVADDASLATVLQLAIEHIKGMEGSEGGGEGESEGGGSEEAERAKNAAVAAVAESLKTEVAELRKWRDERIASERQSAVDTFLAEQIDANRINPNDEKAVAAARAYAEKDLDGAKAFFASMESYAPSKPTSSAPPVASSGRKAKIAAASREWKEGGMNVSCPVEYYVDEALRESGEELMSDAEKKALCA